MLTAAAPMVTLGVVGDTHVPDRARGLPDGTLAALAGVDAILHTGDVCVQRVLDQLAQVAPVHAVAGNRDFFLRLPKDRVLTFESVSVGLTHGHGGWLAYLNEKLLYYTVGYYLPRFLRQVRRRFSGVQVIVFGHSHRPVNMVMDGVLMFNPGSLAPDFFGTHGPAVGRLVLDAGRVVRAERVPLRAERVPLR